MGRIATAIRAFFGALFNSETSEAVRMALAGPKEALPAKIEDGRAKKKESAKPKPPARSEALTLLSALQRDARFVDFIQENLDDYSDAQIGAAVRDVHRGCGEVLDRLFGLKPLLTADEGEDVEVPAGFDAGKFRLTGNVTGDPPFQGKVAHHGWEASRVALPEWSGSGKAARVVAPAEVEL